MKKIFFLSLIICNFFFNAFAFRIEYGKNIIINQPVYEDLYVAGGNVTINAPVYGDLIVAGGTVIINDSVMNDILLVGGNVTFNGFAGDDIRCAGGNIHFSKSVTGDVVIAGGEIIIDNGVDIGGLIIAGGNITIDGNIKGEVRGGVGNLILNGKVAKNLDCRGGKITINGTINGKSILAARIITIGNNASFNDDVRYWNKKSNIDFKKSLKSSEAIFDPSLRIRTGQWYYLGAATLLGLLWYLGMALLMIFFVQYLFSSTMKKAADIAFGQTLKSIGFGLLFLIGVPVLAVVAFITLIGVPIGVFLLISYIILLLLVTVIISVVTANWLNNRNNYKWGFWRMTFIAFGIFVLLKIVSLTPFVGWIVMLIMTCIVFGAILSSIEWKRKQEVSMA